MRRLHEAVLSELQPAHLRESNRGGRVYNMLPTRQRERRDHCVHLHHSNGGTVSLGWCEAMVE